MLCTGVLPVRLRALGDQRQRQQQVPGPAWLDLASDADPMADGPYLAAMAPLGEVHLEVTYQASVWADHRAYLRPGTEALRRLLAALVRVAPPPGDLGVARPGAAARRLRWLVIARRAAVLSGLLAAVVLLARLPAPLRHAWLGIAGFILLWAMGAAVAYAVLKSCWRLWDYAHRGYETAAADNAADTDVPVATGFALLLEMLVLAVAWPLVLARGWWSALLREGTAVAAVFDRGDPAQRPSTLLIEAALAILVVFGITVALGSLLSRPVVVRGLERRRHLPDPVAAGGLLLRQLPEEGLVVGDGHYHAALIAWSVSVPRLWRHGPPSRCTVPVRMLLRNDAVVLDLRAGCLLDGRLAHVHGGQVHWAQTPAAQAGSSGPRLASARDWRAFRHDLPELLDRVSASASLTPEPLAGSPTA